MNRLEQIAFDLDFNRHKMSLCTVKEKLSEFIFEVSKTSNHDLLGRLKYAYSIMNENNYKEILDKELQ